MPSLLSEMRNSFFYHRKNVLYEVSFLIPHLFSINCCKSIALSIFFDYNVKVNLHNVDVLFSVANEKLRERSI